MRMYALSFVFMHPSYMNIKEESCFICDVQIELIVHEFLPYLYYNDDKRAFFMKGGILCSKHFDI